MGKNSFTIDEIKQELRKTDPHITDEELEAGFHILLHEGYLRKISQDIYEKTNKEPPKQ